MTFRIPKEIFRVKPLTEGGYLRQKCKVCGADFWSLVERDDCNDAPCVDYRFFDLKLKVPPLSVKEVRDLFLKFFSKRGHELIEPYPVVARWREDLYLTIASIIVFQPHVTSGRVPPPANPLVIAQPCIRLEDIESIGYTLGRHLTNFIMGGHHAFNYPDKFIYFTDETVELAREFFVNEIGVPEDKIVFKESWWEGGGNAGPSFEVAVEGLEVATLVFMIYDVINGKYVEMPIKIVDTGYGIERIAWLTQKTPTAFHAIYGNLVSKYHDIVGIPEPPEDLLRVTIKYAGRLNPKDGEAFRELSKLVADSTGYSASEVSSLLGGAIRVYTLLDHIKTALLMLSDGIVPSNSGEGYLARLVLRKIFRHLRSLGALDTLEKLIKLQIDFWHDLYPRLREREDYIFDVTDFERRKFEDLVKRAPEVVRRYLKRGPGLGLNELIELYDSHGIPPENVAEVAKSFGVVVSVPKDFYSVIASRHSRAPIKKVEKLKLPEDVVRKFRGLPPTDFLFHKDQYIREFTAKVVATYGKYVVLDKTAFYPEGGGQEADTGVFYLPDGRIVKVVDVQKIDNVVVHKLSSEVPDDLVGKEVKGVIDWSRRYVLMRHHTATHIILGVSRKLLGQHVWQAGAEKTERRGRLDITHYRTPTPDEIKALEDEANKVILEGREVRAQYLPRYEAERKYGLVLYQGGVPQDPVIRVVEIPGLDAEACFGTHLKNTMEVGGIKIINVEKIQDGVVRLEYVAGTQLAQYARELESKLSEASKIVGGDVVKRVKSLVEERRRLKELLNVYRSVFVESKLREFESRFRSVGNLRLLVEIQEVDDEEAYRELLLKLTKRVPNVALVLLKPKKERFLVEISMGSEASKVVDAVELLKYLTSKYGGRGGGKRDHATGFIPAKELDVKEVEELLTQLISRAGR